MNNRSMDSRFSSTVNGNSDMKNKKKEEVSVKLSILPVPKVEESLSSDGLQFDRLQPSDYELVREKRLEFGQFVARDAVLDEEYWVCFMNRWTEEKMLGVCLELMINCVYEIVELVNLVLKLREFY